MRLDVRHFDSRRRTHTAKRGELVEDRRMQLIRCHLHLTSTKALQVGKARVSADTDTLAVSYTHLTLPTIYSV